jgi:hypothetical protein
MTVHLRVGLLWGIIPVVGDTLKVRVMGPGLKEYSHMKESVKLVLTER